MLLALDSPGRFTVNHAEASERRCPSPSASHIHSGVGHGRGMLSSFRRAVKFFLTQRPRIRSHNLGCFEGLFGVRLPRLPQFSIRLATLQKNAESKQKTVESATRSG